MTTVTYTTEFFVDSSAVDIAVYDERTKEFTLDLNDRVYRYTNVPKDVAERIEKARSVGRDFLPGFKRTYGPGEYLGEWSDVTYKKVDTAATPQAVGTVQDFTPKNLASSDQLVSVSSTGDATFSTGNSTGTSLHFALSVPGEDKVERRMAVNFLNDEGNHKTYNTKAASAEEAKAQVEEVAEALGVNLTVRSVTVYFE